MDPTNYEQGEDQAHNFPFVSPNYSLSSSSQQYYPCSTSEVAPALGNNIDWASTLLMLQSTPLPADLGEGGSTTSTCGNININNNMEIKRSDNVKVNSGKGMIKKVNRPRIAFHTRSDNDILDDGYRWRKYGQKAVKNSNFPRNYYRCTHHTCNVKKQVQRLSKDASIIVTTYEGVHNHPCEKLMEALSPLIKQIQFLSSF